MWFICILTVIKRAARSRSSVVPGATRNAKSRVGDLSSARSIRNNDILFLIFGDIYFLASLKYRRQIREDMQNYRDSKQTVELICSKLLSPTRVFRVNRCSHL